MPVDDDLTQATNRWREHTLLSTTDGRHWAEEFCRIFQGKVVTTEESQGVDPGVMLSWFATAIETGRVVGRVPGPPRRFVLNRHEDPSGVSGTGVVAEGIEFSDGVVCLHWVGQWPSSVVHYDRGMESVEHVHGHGGSTEIRYLD